MSFFSSSWCRNSTVPAASFTTRRQRITEREGAPRTLTFDAGRRARPWVGAVAHQMLYPAFLVGLIAFLVAFVQLLAPGLLAEQLERLQGRPPSVSRG